jgi:hypothetical protein
MGRLVIKSLQQMQSKGYDLRLFCHPCQRVAVLRGDQLVRWVQVLKWPSDFDIIAERFPCRCGKPGEWSFIRADDGRDVFDLAAVARGRRDAHVDKAKFWHDVAAGRDPGAFRQKRGEQRRQREHRDTNAKIERELGKG